MMEFSLARTDQLQTSKAPQWTRTRTRRNTHVWGQHLQAIGYGLGTIRHAEVLEERRAGTRTGRVREPAAAEAKRPSWARAGENKTSALTVETTLQITAAIISAAGGRLLSPGPPSGGAAPGSARARRVHAARLAMAYPPPMAVKRRAEFVRGRLRVPRGSTVGLPPHTVWRFVVCAVMTQIVN